MRSSTDWSILWPADRHYTGGELPGTAVPGWDTPNVVGTHRSREDCRHDRAYAGADHRDRILGAGDGHRAAEAGRGLPDPGEGRRGRRHLAGQHLSGRSLRRAVAPVLVLVRAEAGLGLRVLPSARDPRLPQRRHRPPPAAAQHRVQRQGVACALGRRRVPLARLHRKRRGVRRPVPDLGGRRAAHPVVARHPRPVRIRRSGLPYRAVGPHRRPHGQEGGRDRHGRQRDPSGARAGQDRQPGAALSAHRRRGSSRESTSPFPPRSSGRSGSCQACGRRCGRPRTPPWTAARSRWRSGRS